jgi:pimeloyl-ACP methyl ester carboxylesterase
VVTAGEGPLVLLLHGFPESWYSWRHQLAALADAGYRAAAPDMRGYGRSAKPPEIWDYRITELVDDCVGIVEALGERQAVVVGHDWGAPVAWTAAWTRPDVFRAVVGVSVPFGGRGPLALPGDPHGEIRPSEVGRQIAGPGKLFYDEYFSRPELGEAELESDPRGWLVGALYGFSGSPPKPPALEQWGDLTALRSDQIVPFLRETMVCLPPGVRFRDFMVMPDELPPWLTQEDVEFYVGEFERTGFRGPLNYYRCIDLDWELLAGHAGRPITVPAMFLGGDRDTPTIWGRDAIDAYPETIPELHRSIIVPDCGHWVQQEHPELFNDALLDFLGRLD